MTLKKRIKQTFNLFKNINKFNYGWRVKVIKNNSQLKKYDKLVGKIGTFAGIEYSNYDNPFLVNFTDLNETYCFQYEELEKVD